MSPSRLQLELRMHELLEPLKPVEILHMYNRSEAAGTWSVSLDIRTWFHLYTRDHGVSDYVDALNEVQTSRL